MIDSYHINYVVSEPKEEKYGHRPIKICYVSKLFCVTDPTSNILLYFFFNLKINNTYMELIKVELRDFKFSVAEYFLH